MAAHTHPPSQTQPPPPSPPIARSPPPLPDASFLLESTPEINAELNAEIVLPGLSPGLEEVEPTYGCKEEVRPTDSVYPHTAWVPGVGG